MELFIMQFSLASYYFIFPLFKYFHQHPVLSISVWSSFNVRGQVSHVLKIAGKTKICIFDSLYCHVYE
jgi:hypothetical protein